MYIPMPRFFYLLGTGFLLSGMSLVYRDLGWTQYLLYLLLGIACAADWLLIPRKKDIRPHRIHERYLSLSARNPVTIAVENASARSASLVLRDMYPESFTVIDDTMTLRLSSRSTGNVRYYAEPVKKGHYDFQEIHIRVSCFFGLGARQYRYRISTGVKVYPNLIEMKKYLRLASVNRLEQIGYRLRELGGETEFDFLRDYQHGDDYKKINWKATAKKRFPVTQVYEKEYNRNIVALLDSGRMMTTRYGAMTKLDLAVNASLMLAAAATNRKDHYGVMVFSDSIHSYIPPMKESRLYGNILPALYAAEPEFSKTDYYGAYSFLQRRLQKNSLLFVFSELYNSVVSEELINVLMLLSKHHRVNFISFEEWEKEPEGKDHAAVTRWVLQQDQHLEKERIVQDLKKRGVHTIRVNRDDITRQVVNSYLSS
ncbi:MAG TPA: DUF58 domain-containing protein [Spirochaetota bacterium]|nr:DUF58 domain-containing protein [Spirochaetota bacterium]HQP48268.1 DUF58 domain-containing protein [Spirochaetota bacterium]